MMVSGYLPHAPKLDPSVFWKLSDNVSLFERQDPSLAHFDLYYNDQTIKNW